jgi:hypothetical protein
VIGKRVGVDAWWGEPADTAAQGIFTEECAFILASASLYLGRHRVVHGSSPRPPTLVDSLQDSEEDAMAAICSPEMPRRAFMGVITGGLLAAPLAAEAQPAGKVWIATQTSSPGDTRSWRPS